MLNNNRNELIIKKSIQIEATRNQVWEALTNPELTKKYFFNCEVISDWKVGGSIIYRDNTGEDPVDQVKGKLTEVEPGEKFEYTFQSTTPGASNLMKVTFELFLDDGFTKLTVTQDCGDNEKAFNDSEMGWVYVLNGLKKMMEE